MPKDNKSKKRKDDSDTSDSGPEPEKSVKSKPAAPAAKKTKTDDDELGSWHLEGMRYVKVRSFKGKPMVDIREFYEADGELRPGRKGISLSASQWRKLEGLTSEIDEALKNC